MEPVVETITTMGEPRRYELDGATLRAFRVPAPTSRPSLLEDPPAAVEERRVELGEVDQVRLGRLGTLTVCELSSSGTPRMTVGTDERAGRDGYRRLVTAIHAAVGARPGVRFVRGSWSLVVIVALIGVAVFVAGLAIHQGWIAVPPALAGKASVVMILAVAWIGLGPLLAWRSRPRSYDPSRLPPDLV